MQKLQEMWVQFLSWEDPLEEAMVTYSAVLAWEVPRQRSLVEYSPWCRKELDMASTKRNKNEIVSWKPMAPFMQV